MKRMMACACQAVRDLITKEHPNQSAKQIKECVQPGLTRMLSLPRGWIRGSIALGLVVATVRTEAVWPSLWCCQAGCQEAVDGGFAAAVSGNGSRRREGRRQVADGIHPGLLKKRSPIVLG